MPRPALPPTPISSTDIIAKDGSNLSSLELSFTLPPPAIARENGSRSSTSSAASSSASSYRPVSPRSPLVTTEPAVSRKRSAAQAAKEDFALPPPPTRSRKIIQMKPRPDSEPQVQRPATPSSKGTPSKSNASASAASQSAAASKRKQPSATSVAGRKIARKTAHSLIERRRRSKMNEEFGVLKQMIPACRDQEMHKLAILQASIDYLRYLEQCITDLKENNNATQSAPTPSARAQPSDHASDDDNNDNDNDDHSMHSSDSSRSPSAEPHSPHTTPQTHNPAPYQQFPPQQQHDLPTTPFYPTTPSIAPSTSSHRHYSFSTASGSPAFPPQQFTASTSTSPALLPQDRDVDQEATAALLLLNTADRRSGSGSVGRGMSVKDLLSG